MGQTTKYQRTKFLICYLLETRHSGFSASCQELYDDMAFLLTLGSIRTCASRMHTGYIRPGKRYDRHYLYKLQHRRPAIYRLSFKGRKFVSKMFKYHALDCQRWLDELVKEQAEREELQKYIRSHYKIIDPKSISKRNKGTANPTNKMGESSK